MRQDRAYCCECYERRYAVSCHSCGDVIGVDEDQLSKGDLHWHANDKCYSCCNCGISLVGRPFLPKGKEIYCSLVCSRGAPVPGKSTELHKPDLPQLRKVKETTFDEFNNVHSDVKLVEASIGMQCQVRYEMMLSDSAHNSRNEVKSREDAVILAIPVEDLEGKDSTYGTETSSVVEEDIQKPKFLPSRYALERSHDEGKRFPPHIREQGRGYDTDCPTTRVSRNSSERSNDRGYETDGAAKKRSSKKIVCDYNNTTSRMRRERGGYETDSGKRSLYGEYNVVERGYETDGAARCIRKVRNDNSSGRHHGRNGESVYETADCAGRVRKDSRFNRSRMKENTRTVIYTDLMNNPTEQSFDCEAPLGVVYPVSYERERSKARSMAPPPSRIYSSFRESGQCKNKTRDWLRRDDCLKVNSHSMENIDRVRHVDQSKENPDVGRRGMRRTSRNISSESSARERKGSSTKKNLPWEDPFANPVARPSQEKKHRRIRYVDELGGVPDVRVSNQCSNKTPVTERKTKSKKECRVQ